MSLIFTFLYVLLLSALGHSQRSILVLLDNENQRDQYKSFFSELEDRGYTVTFGLASDSTLSLSSFGEFKYDHLVVLSSVVEDLEGVTAESILEFVDTGHNVFIAVDENVGDPIRQLAKGFGVHFHGEETKVIDFFHYSGDEVVLRKTNLVPSSVVVGKEQYDKPILFNGIGHSIKEGNGLNFAILSGHETTYSGPAKKSVQKMGHDDLVFGNRVTLVSALQARNNARVIVSGSSSLLSEEVIKRDCSNGILIRNLVSWFLNERGVLRVSNATDTLKGEGEQPFYFLKQDVVFSAIIEEHVEGRWVPFISDAVQLEFRMLDPYIRSNLRHDGNGKYEVEMKVPDTWGVFTFHLRYRGKGYNHLDYQYTKPVRPTRHDAYPRFLLTATPYYAGSISMALGVVLFSVGFLFSK
eukprot:TRINITY_DN3416_c0_g2_i6.p1 TRINITY_DN3416_c0_g2~~TRINITY_DN3416_c0_g2_i6.p1  ORF type:complete len:411 (-),score=76.60 TRINITY_DN3416_c0_g2_i6:62-1294(-)